MGARLDGWKRRVDARPVTSWAVVAGLLGVCVAWPGTMVGELLTDPTDLDGVGWPTAVVCGICVLVAGLMLVPVADLPARWFGLSRRRSRGVAVAAVAVGFLPWLSWHGPSVSGAPREPFWAGLFYAAGALALSAAALLLVPGRRTRAAGAVLSLVAVAVWWPARQGFLGAEAADALHDFGGPPRAQVQFVHWPAATPAAAAFRGGRLVVSYEPEVGEWMGALVVAPLPGAATDADLCRAAQDANQAGDEAVFGVRPDADRSCRPFGHSLVRVGPDAMARRESGWLLVVMEEPGEGDPADLAAALRTARPADDAEVRSIDTGPMPR